MGWAQEYWKSIDWAATGAWMQAWAGFLGASAVFYAARKGADTFQIWLRQRQVERRMDVAERVLDVAYRLRRAFSGIRSPGFLGQTGVAAEKKLRSNMENYDKLPEEQQKRLVWSQVILTRVDDYAGDLSDLIACIPLAKAHFGVAAEAPLENIWAQRSLVITSAQGYGQFGKLTPEIRERFERNMWEGSAIWHEKADVIGDSIQSSIDALETLLLPMLRSEIGR